MPLTRKDIARLIPHGASMSLLDAVAGWDTDRILCTTTSHRRGGNPLWAGGMLPSACLIEYGAQAAALHCALGRQGQALTGPAYLGSVKDAQWHSETVNKSIDKLHIEARCVMQQSGGAIYQIKASAGAQPLIEARIVLVQAV
ncbi:MAG TPA: hydroxymyristoyl-ACP dehydratase [Gammaproteobacteria bacterium]|nr:hydroxymyristoyl-ACP dehydratase [Gammaproteobacteria bacterium]